MAGLLAVASSVAAAVPDLFGGGRLVAYTPRGFDPRTGRAPGPASLRVDADELRRYGFRAITTSASTRPLMPVCRVFKRRGFRTVLVGVADPADRTEVRTAIKQRRCADGYVVGNGGLAAGRYTRDDLGRALRRLRATTGRPATVREALAAYDADSSLVTLGDWLFPLANPYLAGQTDPQEACGYSARRYVELRTRVRADVPIVLAETALPTAGYQGASENYQRAFFLCIETRSVRFEYFEAFDQPWRTGSPGAAHWGLFRDDGTPKMLMTFQTAPRLALRAAGGWVRGRVLHAAPEPFRVVVYTHAERWDAETSSAISRRGKWKARVAGGREVAALLVARSYVPPSGLERLPQVDGAGVFAVAGPVVLTPSLGH